MHKLYPLKEIQLALIRIYVGLDFIPHFSEKFGLLGPAAYNKVTAYFASTGMSPTMVTIAGLCEFAAFIGFTFGFLTRIAAIGTSIYLIIALFSGNHQHLGFTWANPGGGWEFPAFWTAICLSFVLTGGGIWSIDNIIAKYRRKKSAKA